MMARAVRSSAPCCCTAAMSMLSRSVAGSSISVTASATASASPTDTSAGSASTASCGFAARTLRAGLGASAATATCCVVSSTAGCTVGFGTGVSVFATVSDWLSLSGIYHQRPSSTNMAAAADSHQRYRERPSGTSRVTLCRNPLNITAYAAHASGMSVRVQK